MTDIKETVYNDLTHRIMIRDLQPGQQLHEKEIMEHYDIGKTPLREVMLLLQVNGFIRRFPRSGTIVAPIDLIELRETAEIRLALERMVSEIVIGRISPDEVADLKKLSAELARMAAKGITAEFVSTESRLHSKLYEACRNTKLIKLLNEQQFFFARMWYSFDRTNMDIQSQVNDWRNICEAVSAKDIKKMKKVYPEHFKTFFESLKVFF